jgi:hypothetical protein
MAKQKLRNDDNKVDIHYTCDTEDCKANGKPTIVKPWFFSENGNPICAECGNDLSYVRTVIIDKRLNKN